MLNNFRWVPDSFHRHRSKSSRQLFEEARTNAVIFLVFRDFGWVWGSLRSEPLGCESIIGALQVAARRFEAIRARIA